VAYYDALVAKWATLPVGTTQQKLDNLNAQTVSVTSSTTVPSYVLYNAIVPSEFQALVSATQQLVRDVLSLGVIDISNTGNARTVILQAFAAGTQTRTNLVAAQAALARNVPWTTFNGYPPTINANDLAAAGLS
jgi:hypothetical protein